MTAQDLLTLPQSEIIELSKVALFERFSRSTVTRWILHGKLQALKIGGKWVTTRQAIRDFLTSCQPEMAANVDPRAKSIEREKAFLEAQQKLQKPKAFAGGKNPQ